MNQTTAVFHQLRQTVYVSGRTVVVDRYNWVFVFFAQCTYHVVSTFLHFCIGTLDSVQLDTRRVTSCFYRRNGTTTQTDAVVVTTHNYDLVSCFGATLQAVALCAVTHTTCQHDNLVVGIFFVVFFVFESQNRTTNQRLSELVTKVRSTV